jgi:hypothetical protein
MEGFTPAELRSATLTVGRLGLEEGQDLGQLPSVAEHLPAGADVSDVAITKGDRYGVAAPTINKLAACMLEGDGVETRFRFQPDFSGFTTDERLLCALRNQFKDAGQDPALDPQIHAGIQRFAALSDESSPLQGPAILTGADYPAEMHQSLIILASLMQQNQETAAMDDEGRRLVACQVLPRYIGRMASMHQDDFVELTETGQLHQEGRLTLRKSDTGRWLLESDGQLSASALRAKEAEQRFMNADTIEIPRIAPDPLSVEEGNTVGNVWRRISAAFAVGRLLSRRLPEESPQPTGEISVESPLETDCDDVAADVETRATPPLTCPAHHRLRKGEFTALERYIFAGINLAADNGYFNPDQPRGNIFDSKELVV